MNDEVRQIQEETFRRILLGIVVIGLVAAVAVFVTYGVSSPWFIRALALLIAAGIAFIIRLFSRLVVASYMLVLQLVGLLVGMFLQPDPIASFIPYLFIPVVVIAGFLLSPLATFILAVCSILAVLLIIFLTGQLTLNNLVFLLPSFGLTLVVAFLAAEAKRYMLMLGDRLLEDRKMLKERTLEMMDTAAQTETLKDEISQLKVQVGHAKREVKQAEWLAEQRFDELFKFVQGAIQELDTLIKQLEEPMEELGEVAGSSEYISLVEATWQKLYHVKAMVINLEEISQLEHGKIQLDYQAIDVERFISEAVGTTQGLVRSKEIEVRYQVADSLPPLQADPIRLRQALTHVLSNSVRYTDRGIIEIQAETNDKNELLIFISDTGIGMHREEIDLIFNKFGRGSGPMARQRQGAGLGLSISKRLVELHGGRMWVTSVLGVGSTFYMAFPLEPVAGYVDSDRTVVSLPAVKPTSPAVTVPRTIPAPIAAAAPAEDDFQDETLVMPRHPAPQPANAHQAVTVPDEGDEGATLVMNKSPLAQVTASNADPGALPGAAPIAAPPATGQTESGNEGGTTLVLSSTLPPPPDDDDETTLVLPKKKPHQTGAFAHPIRRFGTTYTRRFGMILGSILLVVALVVITLALINGPVEQQMNATATAIALATNEAAPLSGSTSPTPQDVVVQLPTPTPTVESAPTSVPVQESPATPTHTPTQMPPTPKPTNTAPPTPQPSPTAPLPTNTPTQTATITPTPGRALTVPAVVRQFVAVSDFSNLTFSAPQSGSTLNGNADPASIIQTTDNSRFSWSPTGQLLFAGEQGGNRDIFTAGDGSESIRLTSAASDDWQPDWSPDGTQVAFSSNRTGNFDIYVMDANGNNLTQLTTSRGFDEWPVWSPDGSKIAFVSDRDGNVEIYIMDADGSNQQRITNNPADDWPASWSPDGSRLVFASDRDGDWNLFITLSTGGPIARLTNAPGAERDPFWSPDGQTIAFAYNNGQGWDIYTLPAPDGSISEVPFSQWTQITNTPTDERYPTWPQLFK